MKALAVVGLLAACAWVSITYPVVAICAAGAFAAIGSVYEVVRNQK